MWKTFIIDEAWQRISKTRAAENLDQKDAIISIE
jgi:hypothetical protein